MIDAAGSFPKYRSKFWPKYKCWSYRGRFQQRTSMDHVLRFAIRPNYLTLRTKSRTPAKEMRTSKLSHEFSETSILQPVIYNLQLIKSLPLNLWERSMPWLAASQMYLPFICPHTRLTSIYSSIPMRRWYWVSSPALPKSDILYLSTLQVTNDLFIADDYRSARPGQCSSRSAQEAFGGLYIHDCRETGWNSDDERPVWEVGSTDAGVCQFHRSLLWDEEQM